MARQVVEKLRALGHACEEVFPPEDTSVDYPDFAEQVGASVVSGGSDRGILVCHTGIGMSIAANKVPGVRAARCIDAYDAELCRRHNHANVLCLGERNVDAAALDEILRAWLDAECEGGRHARRVSKVESLERG
jgi:ribose 5-phosphate isomerase B